MQDSIIVYFDEAITYKKNPSTYWQNMVLNTVEYKIVNQWTISNRVWDNFKQN